MCALILWHWFWIANGQISSIFDNYLPTTQLIFHFQTITWVNLNGFSPNLVCAKRMGKFCQILIELSACDTSIFLFPDDNLSKYQWLFTKLGMCIDIVEIWFGIANEQISSIFDKSYLPATHTSIFSYPDDNLSKYR